ncbi:MAG TPA: extensin family protein [Pseudolabrys sp.]
MVAKGFRNELRESACNRFTTVSGPGSDGHHEVHIYFDVIERHQGSRMCQWDVREPSVTDVAAPGPAADTAAGNNGHDCKSCAEIVIVIPSSD